jgi:hypothetical protein
LGRAIGGGSDIKGKRRLGAVPQFDVAQALDETVDKRRGPRGQRAMSAVQLAVETLAVEAGDEIGNMDAGDKPLRGGRDDRVGDLEPLSVGDHLQVRKVKRDQHQISIASRRVRRRSRRRRRL